MITKKPKFLYFLLFLVALTAGDAWRRSWQQNDLAVNQAISPLRKNIIGLNRELSEIKVLLKKQQVVILKLEKQLEEQNIQPIKQSKKTIDLINPDENKLLDKLVNGIAEKTEVKEVKTTPVLEKPKPEIKNIVVNKTQIQNNKLDEFPDVSALAATNVTPEIISNDVADIIPEIRSVKKEKQKLPQLKRVTSLPAHTAVPEIVIPDKNPDLTSKTIDEKVEARTPSATSLSQTMLSGKKRGVRVTISDVLDSYEDNNNKTDDEK